MKPLYFIIIYSLISQANLLGQNNNTLRGEIKYLNSGKKPAVGVKVAGSIKNIEKANSTYTLSNGEFELKFPETRTGHLVNLEIGETDKNGIALEVVNAKEVELCRIPAYVTDIFKIIVCKKGDRDLAAQRYYKILKTSSDIALKEKEKELITLLNDRKKDYSKITSLTSQLDKLQQQADSASIYEEALRIASINKDDASKRVLRYIQLLDKGKSVQEAREVLSIKEAAKELSTAVKNFQAAIVELETRAGASEAVFDYVDAMICYDTIINYSEKMNIDKSKLADYYMKGGMIYYQGGQYNKALEYQQKVVFIAEAILDSKHPDLATAYVNVALTYTDLGDYQNALSYNKKAIAICEEKLDPKHPDLAIAYNNISVTYTGLGDYQNAFLYNQKAIAIGEEKLDPKNRDLANYYNNIAITYKALGDYEKALAFHLKASAIREEILDSQDPILATSYDNIALTYRSLGDYQKALLYNQKAISIFEAILDPKHPYLATSYNDIALIYTNLGDYQNALLYNQKAITIYEEMFDPKHPGLAIAYDNIALTYRSLGDYENALLYNQKAIIIFEAILDPKHPNLAIAYNNIALTYEDLGQYEKALLYNQKAIGIREAILDPKHPDLATTYNNIGNTYQAIAAYDKALIYKLKAIDIMEAILDSKHPDLAIAYDNIAVTYRALNQFEKAIEYNQKAISIFEAILDSKHPDLAISYSNLALTYSALKSFREAFYYQEKCLVIFKEILPENHPYRQEALNRRLNIYYAEAIDFFEKKDYTAALHDLDTLNRYSNSYWNLSGLCHYFLSAYPQAILAYQKAVSLSPEIKTKQYYNNIGMAYVKNKQYPEARASFTEYEKLFPKEGRAFRNWAMYYALQKDRKKALPYLRKAIELGYDDVEWLKTDNSMDSLRKEKVFKEIVEKLGNTKNKK